MRQASSGYLVIRGFNGLIGGVVPAPAPGQASLIGMVGR